MARLPLAHDTTANSSVAQSPDRCTDSPLSTFVTRDRQHGLTLKEIRTENESNHSEREQSPWLLPWQPRGDAAATKAVPTACSRVTGLGQVCQRWGRCSLPVSISSDAGVTLCPSLGGMFVGNCSTCQIPGNTHLCPCFFIGCERHLEQVGPVSTGREG